MKKVIVIGASSGMGQRIASDFARVGCRVGMAARRKDRLEKIKERYPENTAVMEIDVTAEDCVERFYKLIELIDGMDILVFAAGCGYNDPDLDPTILQQTLQVNVVGFARILAAAFRYYAQTASDQPGQIAAITSVAATKGLGVAAAYSASKRFQTTFIDALEQLAYSRQVNVRFTDIRPGFVRTDLLDPARDYPMTMSLDYVAPRIEEAILRRRRRVVIDSRWGVVTALWRLLPQRLWRHLNLTSL